MKISTRSCRILPQLAQQHIFSPKFYTVQNVLWLPSGRHEQIKSPTATQEIRFALLAETKKFVGDKNDRWSKYRVAEIG